MNQLDQILPHLVGVLPLLLGFVWWFFSREAWLHGRLMGTLVLGSQLPALLGFGVQGVLVVPEQPGLLGWSPVATAVVGVVLLLLPGPRDEVRRWRTLGAWVCSSALLGLVLVARLVALFVNSLDGLQLTALAAAVFVGSFLFRVARQGVRALRFGEQQHHAMIWDGERVFWSLFANFMYSFGVGTSVLSFFAGCFFVLVAPFAKEPFEPTVQLRICTFWFALGVTLHWWMYRLKYSKKNHFDEVPRGF